MAVVNPTQTWIGKRVSKTQWTPLLQGDTGAVSSGHRLSDKTVQWFGTFGTATVALEGSNDGGTTWAALKDANGTDLSALATADVRTILENPQMIRPAITGGDGTTSLTVILVETTAA